MTRGSEADLWGWENGTAQRWADLSVMGQVKPRRSTAVTRSIAMEEQALLVLECGR